LEIVYSTQCSYSSPSVSPTSQSPSTTSSTSAEFNEQGEEKNPLFSSIYSNRTDFFHGWMDGFALWFIFSLSHRFRLLKISPLKFSGEK